MQDNNEGFRLCMAEMDGTWQYQFSVTLVWFIWRVQQDLPTLHPLLEHIQQIECL